MLHVIQETLYIITIHTIPTVAAHPRCCLPALMLMSKLSDSCVVSVIKYDTSPPLGLSPPLMANVGQEVACCNMLSVLATSYKQSYLHIEILGFTN